MAKSNLATTLEDMMEEQGFNARSLSQASGLNDTAVRDILVGKAKCPRYDTLSALATTLGTTPAFLMGDQITKQKIKKGAVVDTDALELLTEIIIRVDEEARDMGLMLSAKKFAKVIVTVYRKFITINRYSTTKKEISKTARKVFLAESNSWRRLQAAKRRAS